MNAGIKHTLKNIAYALLFPLFSAIDRRFGFTIFAPTSKGWVARTRGVSFPVKEPSVPALEYFRHFAPKRGDVVFDVGGELGLEARQFSEIVGPEGRVFTFECFPQHILRLKEIASVRSNVTVVERACWNQKQELEFFTGHTDGSNTAVPTAKGHRGQELADTTRSRIVVQTETLDAMWAQICGESPVDFLKMDIEGAEYEALEGAERMLMHTKKAVIAAYHIRDGIPTAWRVAAQLEKCGFKVRVDDNNHVYAHRG